MAEEVDIQLKINKSVMDVIEEIGKKTGQSAEEVFWSVAGGKDYFQGQILKERERLQRRIYNEEMKQKKKEMKLIKKGLKDKKTE
ncbi:MAG: hypothetical protein QW597_01235 [Thermoplasmataceae archaeon]